MLHDSHFDDEPVVFTHHSSPQHIHPAQHFHHWPSSISPHHSSHYHGGFFSFFFPKHSWKIVELVCSSPYLLITLLSVNRPFKQDHFHPWLHCQLRGAKQLLLPFCWSGFMKVVRAFPPPPPAAPPRSPLNQLNTCERDSHTSMKNVSQGIADDCTVFQDKRSPRLSPVGCQRRMNKSFSFLFLSSDQLVSLCIVWGLPPFFNRVF